MSAGLCKFTEDFMPTGVCQCGTRTMFRCACGDWWCDGCVPLHTSGPNGRCPKVLAPERQKETGK